MGGEGGRRSRLPLKGGKSRLKGCAVSLRTQKFLAAGCAKGGRSTEESSGRQEKGALYESVNHRIKSRNHPQERRVKQNSKRKRTTLLKMDERWEGLKLESDPNWYGVLLGQKIEYFTGPDISGGWSGGWVGKKWRSKGSVNDSNKYPRLKEGRRRADKEKLFGSTYQKKRTDLLIDGGPEWMNQVTSWKDEQTVYIFWWNMADKQKRSTKETLRVEERKRGNWRYRAPLKRIKKQETHWNSGVKI